MNISQMKNIIVLKDLPSNLIDEAIVILKQGNKLKSKERIQKQNSFEENQEANYEIAIKEAEFIVQDYIKNLEKPKENQNNIKKMRVQYKKLQIFSFFLAILAVIRCSSKYIKIEVYIGLLFLCYRTYKLKKDMLYKGVKLVDRAYGVDERIKRAQEIYARRQNLRERTKRARVTVSQEPKNFKLFKKLALQIIICIMIYYIFYLISTTNYVFSDDTLNRTKEIVSKDYDFYNIYNKIVEQINNFIYSTQEKTQEETQSQEQKTEEEKQEETKQEENRRNCESY